jgi:multisubunit Na+/H+ antiporter MnhC subunit
MADAFVGLNLGVAIALLVMGFMAVVAKGSLVRVLLGVEIMGKGVTLSFVTAGYALDQLATAQAIVFTVIVIEVVVTAIALALMVRLKHTVGRLDVGGIRRLSG